LGFNVIHTNEDIVNRFFLSTLAAAAVATAVAPAARAQVSSNPFQIGGAAGIAFPVSDLGNIANTGYNVTLAVGYRPQYLPLGVRVEAAYNQFGLQGGGGNINIPAFTGNLVYTLPGVSFSPYAIGGAGLYRTNVDLNGAGSAGENHFGFNIGGGVKIPLSSSFETFIEARYNRVTVNGGNLSFVPVTVGIMW
jgi:opacity protein-like surface antigen